MGGRRTSNRRGATRFVVLLQVLVGLVLAGVGPAPVAADTGPGGPRGAHPPFPPPGDPTAAPPAAPPPGLPRSTVDRVDDVGGSQVHVMYVLPSDGTDRALDTGGYLAASVESFNSWLAAKTPGRNLQIDTFQGAADVTFFRLNRTDAQVRSGAEFPGPAFVRDIIEKDMKAAGFTKPNTLYAAYYDGHSDFSCGGGAWPPELVGTVGAMYLLGLPDAPVTCASQPLPGATAGGPGYFDFGMLHELLHTLGFVPTCSPNEQARGHVPEPNDLMYGGGTDYWAVPNLELDLGRDDYYQHSSGCIDLDDSPFLRAVSSTVGDFDGSGTTDIAVFRPSTGGWYRTGQPTTFLGAQGDIPVPCDYDGNGTTDTAVFRPSVGAWYANGQLLDFLGLSGDLPVPGDYDGNGRCDIAVFRPSVGAWYVGHRVPVFFGLSGDVPVPGDYDKDGVADFTVFRPSVGGWYRSGAATAFFGLSGDVPVPGDYNGDRATDIAVFRPSTGGWYVDAQSPQFLGLSGDIPVPGDYDGNGTANLAVYRPSTGAWFVQGQSPVFHGISGDVPLPLPSAIRMVAFP